MSSNGKAISIELPNYFVDVVQAPDGKPFMGLMITTSSTMHQFYLADVTNYAEVARKIYDGILKAGQEMKRKQSTIAVADGGMADALRKAEGRFERGQGRSRS